MRSYFAGNSQKYFEGGTTPLIVSQGCHNPRVRTPLKHIWNVINEDTTKIYGKVNDFNHL